MGKERDFEKGGKPRLQGGNFKIRRGTLCKEVSQGCEGTPGGEGGDPVVRRGLCGANGTRRWWYRTLGWGGLRLQDRVPGLRRDSRIGKELQG
jgi:hypothetical protein